MYLSLLCSACSEPSRVTPGARSRLELAKKRGKEFRHDCARCGATGTYHVDDVEASVEESNTWAIVAGLAAAGVFTVVLWERGWISTLSFILFGLVYFAVRQSSGQKATAFNGYKMGRAPSSKRGPSFRR